MPEWPGIGSRVVVWFERVPSKTPREPHEAVVDHVAGRSIIVEGLDATFNRSTGRSKPVRRTPGAFGSDTYVAVDADGDREVQRHAQRPRGRRRRSRSSVAG